MKNNVQIGGVLTAIAAGALLSGSALAHTAGQANQSYVGDGSGHYITDSSGNCVRTGTWKAEEMTVDCGAEPVVETKAPPPPPPPPPQPVYENITLTGSALFAHDKAVLTPEGKAKMDSIADKITDRDRVESIKIIGYTDSSGTEAYNQALSLRRANAVRDYAVELGANPDVISVVGKGESDPVADNSTKEGRAQNRRVEVIVGVRREQ